MIQHAGALIDAVQTVALLVTAGAQIYILLLLRNELRSFGRSLQRVLEGQTEVMITIERVWKRIDAIELKIGIQDADGPGSSV